MRFCKLTLYVLVIFLIGFKGASAQDFRQGNWVLESLTLSNESVTLPDNDELSQIVLLFEDNGEVEPDGISIQACRYAYNFITSIGSNETLTSIEIGMVDPSGNSCTLPENIAFDEQYFDFYNSSTNGTFDIEVDFETNNSSLLLRSSNGDEALYRDNTLSLPNFNRSAIKLYPNPVQDVLILDAPGVVISKLLIISIDGKVLIDKRFESSINIAALSMGMYFLNVVDSQGDTSIIRFIKR